MKSKVLFTKFANSSSLPVFKRISSGCNALYPPFLRLILIQNIFNATNYIFLFLKLKQMLFPWTETFQLNYFFTIVNLNKSISVIESHLIKKGLFLLIQTVNRHTKITFLFRYTVDLILLRMAHRARQRTDSGDEP